MCLLTRFYIYVSNFNEISQDSFNLVAFSMYDLNKNGFITRDEFKFILNMMVGSNITPDQVKIVQNLILICRLFSLKVSQIGL